MHIALVYDAVYPFVAGGVERRNYEVAGVLRRRHNVAIYGFRYWSEDNDSCLAGCRYVGVGRPVPLYDADGRRRISEAMIFAGRLFAALLHSREEVWDVANFPFFSVPVARMAALLRRRRLIVTWYEFWGDYWQRYLGWRGVFGRWVERLALRCSPFIVATSQVTRRRLIAAGYPARRITFVPCGVDLNAVSRVAAAEECHDLIYVGRLLAHKRVELAIEALAELRRTRPRANMAIVGDGPERERLTRRVAELGLESAVRFYGKLPTAQQVYALMKSSRVLVSPSEREGFGISVVEAWGCGIPAVVCAGDENAMTELIDQPAKGRVVDASAVSIAQACEELLAAPCDTFQASLLSAAAAEYDWPRIAERLEAVYEKVMRDEG
ncbi:MAG TPA: glycosyltransferase family 4 protein [Pirellulales bacterium]|nr:glycosyltransferase family 4 protein [Pirellulales bacterium]